MPTHGEIAKACLAAAETNTKSFPEIIRQLVEAGFEGYSVDFRHGQAIYYHRGGESIALPLHPICAELGDGFNSTALQAAIREAQSNAPGYTYLGFCAKAVAAGCVSYLVSFSGRRALYTGRDGGTHTEFFPAN